jgi:hypothetical protein
MRSQPREGLTTVAACLLSCVSIVVSSGLGDAAPGSAERSLTTCQDAARTAGAKYVRLAQGAVGACLARIAGEVIEKNGPIEAAVKLCTTQFTKLGRIDGRSLGDDLASSLAKCEPAPAHAHTLADLLGVGSPGVAEPLAVARLGSLCARMGGDGTIDSAQEWTACVRATHDCALATATASEFPRAVEWLNELAAALPASDARSAVLALESLLDGPSDDGIVSLPCASSCGDGVRAETEQCDGTDLGGATCESLGYALGGLACDPATCAFDTSGCSSGTAGRGFPATGQTTCFGGIPFGPIPCAGTGQDGDIRAGAPLAFEDNGDGTVTDLNTGLTWEKKSDDGSLHDKDNRYAWSGECGGEIGACTRPCQTDADCPVGTCDFVGHGDCIDIEPLTTAYEWVAELNAEQFADHDDWRIPNRRELESLLDLERSRPPVSEAFNSDCGPGSAGNPGCTVLTCSCTADDFYWSSTSYVATAEPTAWTVSFTDGTTFAGAIPTGGAPVRAVRGGT